MKLSNLVGERFKEKPSDCVVDSHALMIRGGYIKFVANGIFSSYTPLRRILRKIENIMREEMDRIDGQEVQFPVVMPASLWQESGRYDSIDNSLLRFKDRNGSKMVLGMTHEEAAVQLSREYGGSYTRYPFMIYQIQTKFRDEARPRAGLIRVREFMMKDAYSFHTSQEDLEKYYDRCYHAYERIFKRAGLPETIVVKSDSGMMGGSVSHEYMLLTPIGEDSIAICPKCGYKSNMEAAESIIEDIRDDVSEDLKKVHTPEMHTIEQVCEYLNAPSEKSVKAVAYQKNKDDSYVIVFIRGDLDVNETKLTNYLSENIHPAVITDESGIKAGFIGPYNMNASSNPLILFDNSIKDANNMICGANETDYHYIGLDMKREFPNAEYHDFAKIKTGGICPICGEHSIEVSRGIEVGNIFQLGTKYTKAMNMTYLDENGESQYPVMGCYGIGVGRLAAAVCEAHHDEYGPIWPMSIAPWQVHLCVMKAADENAHNAADKLYKDLTDAGLETIYDDRKVSAGFMLSDADLLGVPVRVIVSPRNLKEGVAEVTTRDKSYTEKVPLENAVESVKRLVNKLLKSFDPDD